MPAKKKRNYRAEYDSYHSRPEQRKKNDQRKKARREAVKDGRVKKGDSKEIDHKKPLRSGGSNAKSNTRVRSKSANRADNGSRGGRPKGSKNRK